MKFETTPAFFIAAGAALMLDADGLLPATFFAAAFHEAGHIAALYLAGGRLLRLRLAAAGAEIATDMRMMGYGREIAVYLAGPAASLLLAAAAAAAARARGLAELYLISGVSAALGVFNLLPAPALDGGGALRALVTRAFGHEPFLLGALFTVTSAAMLLMGLYGTMRGGFSLPILLFAAWMLAGEHLRDCGSGGFDVYYNKMPASIPQTQKGRSIDGQTP